MRREGAVHHHLWEGEGGRLMRNIRAAGRGKKILEARCWHYRFRSLEKKRKGREMRGGKNA